MNGYSIFKLRGGERLHQGREDHPELHRRGQQDGVAEITRLLIARDKTDTARRNRARLTRRMPCAKLLVSNRLCMMMGKTPLTKGARLKRLERIPRFE